MAYALEVGRCFERVDGAVREWLFLVTPAEAKAGQTGFKAPLFHRTLAEWLNAVVNAGFAIEEVSEPRADYATAQLVPAVQDTQVVADFLLVRCCKR